MDKWLIPREGLLVRDPISRAPLPPEGMMKPYSGPAGRYWRRRVNCGDAIDRDAEKEKKKTLKPSKPEKKRGGKN